MLILHPTETAHRFQIRNLEYSGGPRGYHRGVYVKKITAQNFVNAKIFCNQ